MTLSTLQIGMEWFGELSGGLNRVYANLIERLPALGIECAGLVTGTSDVERLSNGVVKAYAPTAAPTWRRLVALRRAAKPWLRAHPNDGLIVSHFAEYALPLLDAVRGRPFVVHFQGPWGQESQVEGATASTALVKEFLEKRVYRCADAAIVLSAPFADILQQRFGIARERIHVIPGGVDVGRFTSSLTRAEAREQLGWPRDRPTVVCVRRLVRRVGIELLVDAALELRRQLPDVLVHIVGSGPLRSQTAARIASLGLGNTVKLTGFVPEERLPWIYRAADVSVVPTVALEGFGLVTAESLAAGTPCVVTPVDALREIMTPLAPQLITRSASSAAIAEVLSGVLLGSIALPTPGECTSHARAQYDWSVISRRVKHVYENVA